MRQKSHKSKSPSEVYFQEFLESSFIKAILTKNYSLYRNNISGDSFSTRNDIRKDFILYFKDIIDSDPSKFSKLESSSFNLSNLNNLPKLFHYQNFNRMFQPKGISKYKRNDILFTFICAFTNIPVVYWEEVANSYRTHIKNKTLSSEESKNDGRGQKTSNKILTNELEKTKEYLSALERKQFAIYFNKTDNRFYRTFLKFTKIQISSKGIPLIGVEYCSEKVEDQDKNSVESRMDFSGTGFLNQNKNLSIRLQSVDKTKETQTLYLRAHFEYTDPNSLQESIVVGTRSIDSGELIYSGLVVFRLLNNRLLNSTFKLSQRISREVKNVEERSIEETIIDYLASFKSFKTGTFQNFNAFEKKRDKLLENNGRKNFSEIYYPNLDEETWVSLSRAVQNPDHVAISYWTFETNELSREITATRRSHKNVLYTGEVSQCSQDRIWFILSQSTQRKYIVSTYDDGVIKALTTSLERRTSETIVTREIMIPARKLPDDLYQKIQEGKKPSPIRYKEDFLENDKISKEVKGFLSSRKSSVLSFPKLETKFANGVAIMTDYGRKILFRDFEGYYFLYVRNAYKNDGSLFRCTLSVDQLGNADLRKKRPFQRYKGETQQFDKTLNIQFEHVSKKGQIAKQHIQLSIIIRKGEEIPIIFGQIADVDKNGFPDCYACILIPLPKSLNPDGFKTKDIMMNSSEYSDLNTTYTEYINDKEQLGYKPNYIDIESYFTKTGSVSFKK